MAEFLVEHKLITESPHGFLKARSCLTNLFCILEDITMWVDNRSPVDLDYLDLLRKHLIKFHIRECYLN